jgi:hypothetical protein
MDEDGSISMTKKNPRLRSPGLLALAAFATASVGARSAGATTFSYCDFSSTTDLALNGTAAPIGTDIALTNAGTDEAGSIFYGVAVPWTSTTSLHTDFQVQIGSASAEGFSFILQSVGTTALGGDSYQIGYGGVTPSVEVEFDTYMDSWDPNANHVGIMTDGAYKVHLATGTPAFTMAGGGVLYGWVDYDAGTTELDVYLSNTPTEPATPVVSTTVDISSIVGTSAFVGFTSGTGSKTASEQDVIEWELSTDGVPCACGGAADCGGTTPVCATSGPSTGLCVAAVPPPDAGPPDSGPPDAGPDAPDGSDASDGEVSDVVVHKEGGHPEGGKPSDAGLRDGPGGPDSGARDGGHSSSGSDAGSSNGERLSGGACAYAPTNVSTEEGLCLLLAACALVAARSRRGGPSRRG